MTKEEIEFIESTERMIESIDEVEKLIEDSEWAYDNYEEKDGYILITIFKKK
jgi:hypothetical protein